MLGWVMCKILGALHVVWFHWCVSLWVFMNLSLQIWCSKSGWLFGRGSVLMRLCVAFGVGSVVMLRMGN